MESLSNHFSVGAGGASLHISFLISSHCGRWAIGRAGKRKASKSVFTFDDSSRSSVFAFSGNWGGRMKIWEDHPSPERKWGKILDGKVSIWCCLNPMYISSLSMRYYANYTLHFVGLKRVILVDDGGQWFLAPVPSDHVAGLDSFPRS